MKHSTSRRNLLFVVSIALLLAVVIWMLMTSPIVGPPFDEFSEAINESLLDDGWDIHNVASEAVAAEDSVMQRVLRNLRLLFSTSGTTDLGKPSMRRVYHAKKGDCEITLSVLVIHGAVSSVEAKLAVSDDMNSGMSAIEELSRRFGSVRWDVKTGPDSN